MVRALTSVYPFMSSFWVVIPVALPGGATLPVGRSLVRVILDSGLDHYIGVQKEVEFSRAPPNPTPDNPTPK